MSKNKEILQKDDVVQAVLITDHFGDEFLPITNDTPLALLPVVNKPLIDYSLEFLSLGGIEETFVFCTNHVDVIKKYINDCKDKKAIWTHTMQVNIIVSESCHSFGDCLRDLDAKGLIRGNFVLTELGASNIKLLPIIKKHNDITRRDRAAAMTIIYQEAGLGQFGRCTREELLIASNTNDRILFLRRLGIETNRKIDFPLEIFLENPDVSIRHNLKDTHISICSPSVLPLFSDNFDYQTRNDFIKGLLMIDEILDSTIYCHIVKGSQHGGAITNWRMYQAISRELIDKWFYPIVPTSQKHRLINKGVVIGGDLKKISEKVKISKSVIGDNVTIGDNVKIENSYIFPNTKIENNCIITHSIIANDCIIKMGSKITIGSIIGQGVVIDKNSLIENTLVQNTEPKECAKSDKLGSKAYRLKLTDDEIEDDVIGAKLAKKLNRLHLGEEPDESEDEGVDSSDSEDDMSYTNSPVPDDTNLFLTEVTDSLARGFEDKLQCDNLILEINSSRYAYNVTLKEVTYNVSKAILSLPFLQSAGQQYLSSLYRSLLFFSPILKNYIRNDDAMSDCLQAIEDVAASNNELHECIVKILNWFYDKDYISEESIMKWFNSLDKNSRIHARVKPFINWLQEAEEASSSGAETE